jgi:hypothetical protein
MAASSGAVIFQDEGLHEKENGLVLLTEVCLAQLSGLDLAIFDSVEH